MVHLYKELQPTDHFEIALPHALSTYERQLLTLLYQPLTGAEPISLYLMLWAEGEYEQGTKLHYYLMDVLALPIGKILEARIALEAIGLLRTWRKTNDDTRHFIYELQRPLDAASFFKDPLLSMFLYSKIGDKPYLQLRKRFLTRPNYNGFDDVSRSFIDVYQPVNKKLPTDTLATAGDRKKDYPFYYDIFDFELLRAGLSEQLVPASSLTLDAKETIAKLAFMYQLTPIDMQKVVILALDDDLQLTAERLKKAAADYYKLSVSREAPKLTKVAPVPVEPPTAAMTKEQELLHYLETTSPIQFLRDKNNGVEPFASSIQLAEDLLMKHQMPAGVVNVLLEYTMIKQDMKLPRKYVEQIASHWVRKKVRTAKEAMELARQEDDKYNEWKKASEQPKQQPKRVYGGGTKGREEKVPDWFHQRDTQPTEAAQQTIDFASERAKIMEQLGQKE